MRTKTLCEATLFIFSCANLGNLGCLMNLLFFSFTFFCETSQLVTLRKVRFGLLCIVNLSAFLLFDTVGRTAGLRWQKKNLIMWGFVFFHCATFSERTYSPWDYWSVKLNLCLFVLRHTLILSHLRGSFINSHCVK